MDDKQVPQGDEITPVDVNSISQAPAAVRDPVKGTFVKGHAPLFNKSMVGENHGGRPPGIVKQTLSAITEIEPKMHEVFYKMYEVAINNNHKDSQRAKEYLANRIYGMPNQPISGNSVNLVINEVEIRLTNSQNTNTPPLIIDGINKDNTNIADQWHDNIDTTANSGNKEQG